MRALLCVLALVGLSFASQNPIRADRFADTCDDCQSLVSRFISASRDQTRRAQLQSALNVACSYAPRYKAECKVLVKNIERVVLKMEPYMKNHRAVCKRLHLCDSQSEIAAFAKLFMLAAKQHMDMIDGQQDQLCSECQMTAEGISKVIGEKGRQQRLLRFTKKTLCDNTGKHKEICNNAATELIPAFFTDMEGLFADSNKACQAMGMCKSPSAHLRQRRPDVKLYEVMRRFWDKSPKTQQGDTLECFTCELENEVLCDELAKPTSCQNIANQIRDAVCPKLPKDYLAGCEDFLNLYAPTVVVMTVEQMDPIAMCQKSGKCPNSTLATMAMMSKADKKAMACDACRATTTYSREGLKEPQFISDLVAGVENLACQAFPGMYQDLCGTMVETFVPQLLNSFIKALGDPEICEKRALC
ncbi:unnamed protein product, partial [Mesorhabditis belari]|uniref:Saposin B-type domain-containing protein n=1 Tax=Mesorhabditis belari TaxID=2138241 RepID=A0AAF3JAE5_9BILA